MPQDDLVPDDALARRLAVLVQGAQDIYDIMAIRPHLVQVRRGVLQGVRELERAAQETKEQGHPDDPINAKYRSRMRKECFPAFSGTWFYPFDPKVEEVRHVDIVHALPHINRYNGHTSRPLSVCEHSIKVAAMAEHLITVEVREGRVSADYIPMVALYALLDDAHEVYTGDLLGPLRPCLMHVLGIPWTRVEDMVHNTVLEAYALQPAPPEVESAIRLADLYARYNEVTALRPAEDIGDPRWRMHDTGGSLIVPPPEIASIGYVKKEAPDLAKVRTLFDSEVRRLIRIVGGCLPGEVVPWVDLSAIKKVNPGLITDSIVSVPPMTEKLGAKFGPTEPMPEKLFGGAPPTPWPGSNPNKANPVDTPRAQPRGSWKSKVEKAEMDVPPELRGEPEFKKDN